MKKIGVLVSYLTIILLIAPAIAAEYTTIPDVKVIGEGSLATKHHIFDKFNPNLGTLLWVKLDSTNLEMREYVNVRPDDVGTTSVYLSSLMTVTVDIPGPTNFVITSPHNWYPQPDGTTVPITLRTLIPLDTDYWIDMFSHSDGTGTITYTDAPTLASFTGTTGSVDIPVSGTSASAIHSDPLGWTGSYSPKMLSTLQATYHYAATPGVQIKKFTNGIDADTPTGPYIRVGSPVLWEYYLHNTGNVPLTVDSVTDSETGVTTAYVSGDANLNGLLDLTEIWYYTASGTATTSGQYSNTGSVTAHDVNGVPATDTDDSHYYGANPSIEVIKYTNGDDANTAPGPYIRVGSPVTWTYKVTNTGNVPLATVTVTDDKLTGWSDTTITNLAPAAFQTVTAPPGTSVAGQYENTGKAVGTIDAAHGDGANVEDTDLSHYFGVQPDIQIVKLTNDVNAPNPSDTGPSIPVGGTVTWKYRITNTGNIELRNVRVVDDKIGVVPGSPIDSIAPSAYVDLTATGVATLDQYENSVTATGRPSDEEPDVFDQTLGHYIGVPAAIAIVKLTNDVNAPLPTDTGPYITVGNTVTWKYQVTNTGSVVLTNVRVSDPKVDPIPGSPIPLLEPGATHMVELTKTGVADIGQYENTAMATGTPPEGPDVSDDTLGHYFGQQPAIQIVKLTNDVLAPNPGDTGPYIPVGNTVTWKYQVTNTGNVVLTNVHVVDSKVGPIDLGPITLAPGATVELTKTGVAAAGQYENIATATGKPPAGPDVSAQTLGHYFGSQPGIQIVKLTNDVAAPNPGDSGPYIQVGSTVTWKYQVTNTGNVVLTNVIVMDPKAGPITGSPINHIDPGATVELTATGVAAAGQYENTGTATGTPPVGSDVSDDDLGHYFGYTPGIAIKKFTNGVDAPVAPGPNIAVGEPVIWTYQVTNVGTVPLHDIQVTDDKPEPHLIGTIGTLAVGQTSPILTAPAGVAVRDQFENTGTATGLDSNNVPVTASYKSHYYGLIAEVQIIKKTNGVDAPLPPGPHISVDDPVTWTYEVTNTGNVPLTNVRVTDNMLPGFLGTKASLIPQESYTFTAPVGVAVVGQYDNIGTVTATPPEIQPTTGPAMSAADITASYPSHYFGQLPGIILTKEAGQLNAKVGDEVTYTFTVKNIGNTPITLTSMIDDHSSQFVPDPVGQTLAPKDTPGDTLVFTAKYTVTAADLPGPILNTATIEGEDNQGNKVTSTDTATVGLANLIVAKSATPTKGPTGTEIDFLITVENTASAPLTISGVDVLDAGLTYLRDDYNGIENPKNTITWNNMFTLDPQTSKSFHLFARIDATVMGTLWNNVQFTGITTDGKEVSGQAKAEVLVQQASIAVTKEAYPNFGLPGTIIEFPIVVKNDGNRDLVEVTATDTLPDGLEYLSDDHEGVLIAPGVIQWKNLEVVAGIPFLPPGGEIPISLKAIVKGTLVGDLNNVVYVSGVPLGGGTPVESEAQVKVGVKWFGVSKTSDKKVYRPGEDITYTISICNYPGLLPLENVIVKDVFRNPEMVTIVASYPESSEDGLWHIDSIPPGTCEEIIIVARTPKVKTTFDLEQSVNGKGFVNVNNDLSTAVGPYAVDNCVYVTATIGKGEDKTQVTNSTCTGVTIQDLGTELQTREHGSGDYSSEENTNLKWENRSIESLKNVSASYYPTTFELPGNNGLNYASKWTEESRAKNHITGTVMHETYRYATNVDRDSYIKMDENGSKMMVDASFTGKGSIGFFKKASPEDGPKKKPIFESQEDYSGQFSINESFDEYGKNVVTKKAASGEGFVAADKRVRDSQRTYESGTGAYKSEEIVDSFSNYIAKDIEVAHKPSSYNYSPSVQANQDMKWNEGMWSKSGKLRGGVIVAANDSTGAASVEAPCNTTDKGMAPASLISEKYSSLEYMKKDSIALGLNEMKTNATFNGIADFRAASAGVNGTDKVDNEERYAGEFSLNRHILMTGVSKYDFPHITVTKEGQRKSEWFNRINSTVGDYTITITNDGNRALAPVYVVDFFPPGTQYIGSSVKPTALTAATANWTILHLGIGNSLSINLKLNITEEASDNVLNCVQVSGVAGEAVVSSTNCTSLDTAWLGCCASEVSVEKNAKLDSTDPTVVHYTIMLRNNAKSNWAAKVTDQVPADMTLLNSSVEPYSINPAYINWAFANLAPDELVTIEYSMRAARNGAYTNKVHVDTSAVDGSGSGSADAYAYIDVRGTGVAPRTLKYDGWQPPDWELNTSEEGISV